MAEDPVFSGFSSGDAASTFANTISGIKSDMEAIERSAKNIERALSKASKANVGGGGGGSPSGFGAQNAGGNTGFSKDQGMSLGEISSSVPGKMRALAFGGGAIAGGWAGGIATAGLPDLRVTPQQAGNREKARFGQAVISGDFGTFSNMMGAAKTDFNVQNENAFMQTVAQGGRMGMVGMMGGGTVGSRRAGTVIGGYNSLATLAGVDQSQVGGIMTSTMESDPYYKALASGVHTRNPITGEPVSAADLSNQYYDKNKTVMGKSEEDRLTWIDREYGVGSAGRRELLNTYGDEATVQSIVTGMRVRAQNNGESLTTGQLEDAAKNADLLGTDKTQMMEAENRLEGERLELTGEYVDNVTKGMAESLNKVADAVELLAELEGPMRDIVEFYMEMAAELDAFQEEVPGMTKSLTNFFGGLPGAILSALGLKSLLGGGASKILGPAAARLGVGALGSAAAPVAAVAGIGLAVAGVGLLGKEAVYRFTDYDEHKGENANKAIARNAGTNTRSSGYGSYAEGDWNVESDQIARVHHGEMVLPNRVASAVREELALGQTSGPINSRTAPKTGGEGTTVNIYLTVQQASDQEALRFAGRVKRIIDDDRELLTIGSGKF
jgi:hypothetical protein